MTRKSDLENAQVDSDEAAKAFGTMEASGVAGPYAAPEEVPVLTEKSVEAADNSEDFDLKVDEVRGVVTITPHGWVGTDGLIFSLTKLDAFKKFVAGIKAK